MVISPFSSFSSRLHGGAGGGGRAEAREGGGGRQCRLGEVHATRFFRARAWQAVALANRERRGVRSRGEMPRSTRGTAGGGSPRCRGAPAPCPVGASPGGWRCTSATYHDGRQRNKCQNETCGARESTAPGARLGHSHVRHAAVIGLIVETTFARHIGGNCGGRGRAGERR
jgi:hypothetical protein